MKYKHIILISVLLSLAVVFFLPELSLAQTEIPKAPALPGPKFDPSDPGAKFYHVRKFIPFLTAVFIGFAAMLGFVFLIVAGFKYIISYGNEEAIGNAKKLAMWSLIGLIISLLSYSIVSIFVELNIIT